MYYTRIFFFFAVFLLLKASSLNAQAIEKNGAVYESVESPVYDMLQELQSSGYIEYNPAHLPLTRNSISSLLSAAADTLSPATRLYREVAFWRRDFDFEKGYKKSAGFGLNPCWKENAQKALWVESKEVNFSYRIAAMASGSMMNNGENTEMQRGIGLSFFSYLGKNVGLYARLNDKGTTADFMAQDYFSNEVGGNLKPGQTLFGREASDYSELNGGITYAWDWGHVGLVKERLHWGSNQFGANILSGRNPSNVMIDLEMAPTKWFSFKYIHAWLVSEVIDSTRTYLIPGGQRQVFTNKNLAANMFSLGPWKNMLFNFGNSIIYADNGIEPIYLIPIFFFKSADHNNSGAGSNQLGQNAQLFADISYTGVKGVWLYTSLFVDEVNLGKVLDEELHTNLYSLKVGARINSNPYLANSNLALKLEYTRTNPWTYRHQIPSTTFASNLYGLGHYLGENAEEWAVALEYRPLVGMKIELSHRLAYKGADHVYEIVSGNSNVTGLDYLSPATWKRSEASLRVDYHLLTNLMLMASYNESVTKGDISRVHPFMNGERSIAQFGFRLGL